MFKADIEGLREYLLGIGRDRTLVLEALGELGPLLAAAVRGRYDFRGIITAADREQLAGALALAAARPVTRILPLPTGCYIQHFGHSWATLAELCPDLSTRLLLKLNFSHWDDLNTRVWVALQDALDRLIWEAVFRNAANDVAGRLLFAGLTANLRETVLDLIGFAVAGDREGAERFRPLIRSMSGFIPLGESREEPGTWLVVYA